MRLATAKGGLLTAAGRGCVKWREEMGSNAGQLPGGSEPPIPFSPGQEKKHFSEPYSDKSGHTGYLLNPRIHSWCQMEDKVGQWPHAWLSGREQAMAVLASKHQQTPGYKDRTPSLTLGGVSAVRHDLLVRLKWLLCCALRSWTWNPKGPGISSATP